MPPTVRLTIRSVILDLVRTVPVSRFTLPVVGPSLMNCVVAVTGMMPSCWNDPVAAGSVRLAVSLPVLPFTVAASLPGPRLSVKFGALM